MSPLSVHKRNMSLPIALRDNTVNTEMINTDIKKNDQKQGRFLLLMWFFCVCSSFVFFNLKEFVVVVGGFGQKKNPTSL